MSNHILRKFLKLHPDAHPVWDAELHRPVPSVYLDMRRVEHRIKTLCDLVETGTMLGESVLTLIYAYKTDVMRAVKLVRACGAAEHAHHWLMLQLLRAISILCSVNPDPLTRTGELP